MSYHETPEQRQIRELRSKLNSLTSQLHSSNADNSALRREISRVQNALHKENEQLQERLRKQQEQAAKERANLSATIRNLDQQVKERERLQNQRIQQMQTRHEQELTALNNRFETEQAGLREEIQHTRTEMQHGLEKLRNETDEKIRQEREETTRQLDALNQTLGSQINAVDQKVRTLAEQIAAKEDGDREIAEYWAQEAARLLDQIRNTYREQVIDPRRMEHASRKVRDANNDISGGQYQTAISSGREAFYDALDMKEDFAAAELEWNYWYNAVNSREAQLLEDLDDAENRVYQIQTDDGVIEYNNGIDYWTYGQLSVVRNQINDLVEELRNAENMTTDQLRQKEEDLRSLQEQLALVEHASQTNVAMSISRYETAAKIGEILGTDYAMIDSDGEYFATEDREEYHAIFENPNTHDRVAVVITPLLDPDTGLVTNHVEVLAGNSDNSAITRDRITNTVAANLRTRGYDNVAFPCTRRYGDKTAEEVARVGDISAVEAGDEKVRAKLPDGLTRAKEPDTNVTRSRRKA